MKTIDFSIISIILIMVAASSLISMVCLLQIDRIINQDLYSYGLQFSYTWAMPYWTITRLIFATNWFSIIAAIAFHLYVLRNGQKESRQIELEIGEKAIGITEHQTQSEAKNEEIPMPVTGTLSQTQRETEQSEKLMKSQKMEDPEQSTDAQTPQIEEKETEKPLEEQPQIEEKETEKQLPEELLSTSVL